MGIQKVAHLGHILKGGIQNLVKKGHILKAPVQELSQKVQILGLKNINLFRTSTLLRTLIN